METRDSFNFDSFAAQRASQIAVASKRIRLRSSPEGELPVGLPSTMVVARGESTAVLVTGIQVYRAGFEFTVSVRLRDETPFSRPYTGSSHDTAVDMHRRLYGGMLVDESGALLEDSFRFAVMFSDGSVTTNFDYPDPESQEGHPRMWMMSDGPATARRFDLSKHVDTIPSAGRLTFFCEWKYRGLPLSNVGLDGELIHAAARRVVDIWPQPELLPQ